LRYWDSSAIVPLLAEQAASAAVGGTASHDQGMVTWWGTTIECVSALTRLEREGRLDAAQVTLGLNRLDLIAEGWTEIAPSNRVRQAARRLLRVHPLRTGDALQLAAAVVAADGDPRSLGFVTLDDRLAEAAEREGFRVLQPA
jgi:predicted nucleic acid-binding protein